MCAVRARDALQGELTTIRLSDSTLEEALQFAEDVRAGIENADYEAKRRILGLLQVQVVISDKRFSVTSLAGAWDGEIRALPKGGTAGDWSQPCISLRERMYSFYN